MYGSTAWKDLADWRGKTGGREMRKGSGTIIKIKEALQCLHLIFPFSYTSPFCCSDTEPFMVSARHFNFFLL